jgi:hypothetical protein
MPAYGAEAVSARTSAGVMNRLPTDALIETSMIETSIFYFNGLYLSPWAAMDCRQVTRLARLARLCLDLRLRVIV